MKFQANHRGPGFIGLCLISFLAACATQVTPPSQEELDQASRQVLSNAVYTHTLLEACTSVHPELAKQAKPLRQRWMQMNGDYLAAADAHYRQMLSYDTRHYQGKDLSLTAVRFSHQHQARAREELRLDERSQTNQRLVCERRLNTLSEQIEPVMPELGDRSELVKETLLNEYYLAETPMETVPTLAAEVPPNLEPGRSYYAQLEKAKADCPNPELKVFHNDWPLEAYGAYCDSMPYAFIECEWGECHQY